jgi:hypothetical protein
MGHLIGDWMVPVSRVAAAAEVAWHTAHDVFTSAAADAGIVVTDTTTSAETSTAGSGGSGPAAVDGWLTGLCGR